MRRTAVPGATGHHAQGSRSPVEPSETARKRKRSPSDARRSETRAVQHERRSLDTAERELREIRAERDPLARRHMPAAERHVAPDELAARDWSRPVRAGERERDIDAAFRVKRGEPR